MLDIAFVLIVITGLLVVVGLCQPLAAYLKLPPGHRFPSMNRGRQKAVKAGACHRQAYDLPGGIDGHREQQMQPRRIASNARASSGTRCLNSFTASSKVAISGSV